MSRTFAQYKESLKPESSFYSRLVETMPLGKDVLGWMSQNNKEYAPETLELFSIKQGILNRYDKDLGFGRRAFVCTDPCIVIPVGPIIRSYRYKFDKKQRWHVSPHGLGAQWLGHIYKQSLIICEGEWDFLRLQDEGFDNAITHTAGSMTWLKHWTRMFENKRVWICFDRDEIGLKGSARVAKNIFPVANEVRLVDLPLPGTPDKKDINDYFRLGGTADGFRKILTRSRFYVPKIRRTR